MSGLLAAEQGGAPVGHGAPPHTHTAANEVAKRRLGIFAGTVSVFLSAAGAVCGLLEADQGASQWHWGTPLNSQSSE